jgi:hypothetical protein
MKPQTVRIIDVLFLGPLMVYASVRLSGWQQQAMLISGLATIAYNAHNFLRVGIGGAK